MIPSLLYNFIDGEFVPALSGAVFSNLNPHSGKEICTVARSSRDDVMRAIRAATKAQPEWACLTDIRRGDLVRDIALRMKERKEEIAGVVAEETGKILSHAVGEVEAAIEMGFFIAGEGRRNYGKTTTASMANRQVFTIRQPVGIAGLIIASNTPIANVAWKAFPSMFCGNASILKPSEDAPATAWLFADICNEVGVPAGVFNVVQGLGLEAGAALVETEEVDLVSFTGGSETGANIQKNAGARLAKVCMELGGKNALVVCDDADLEKAVEWTLASVFSNAGQRCAAASRVIVDDSIYQQFCSILVERTLMISVGLKESDFLGPVISELALERMLGAVQRAKQNGATVLVGGERLLDDEHKDGFYMQPTLIEDVGVESDISRVELFGPIASLYKVSSFDEAVQLVNNSPYGLTACVHTASLHKAMTFAKQVATGVVIVNGGTHGSEPHMGFGGVKQSGTGWREAGLEALDVYSEWKYVNLITDPGMV